MNIGDRIKSRREELGLSQDELAKRMGYTSRSTINKVEKNINDVSQSNVVKYAKALETTPAYLMGWEDEEREILFNEELGAFLVEIRQNPNLRRLVHLISRLNNYQQANLLSFVQSMQPDEHPERGHEDSL